MKYLCICFFLFFSTVSAYSQEQVLTDEYINITFDENTTPKDIIEIQSALKERNIDLTFKSLVFKNEKLTSISFDVDCNDGYKGSASQGLIAMNSTGFYRDYREGAGSTFGTGGTKKN